VGGWLHTWTDVMDILVSFVDVCLLSRNLADVLYRQQANRVLLILLKLHF